MASMSRINLADLERVLSTVRGRKPSETDSEPPLATLARVLINDKGEVLLWAGDKRYFSIPGATDGSNAAAGTVGEVLTGSGSAVVAPDGVAVNIASVTLTPGDWDVSAVMAYNNAPAAADIIRFGLSATSETLPTGVNLMSTDTSQTDFAMPTNLRRWNVTSNTTIYLVGYAENADSGAEEFSGEILARRVR